MSNDLALIDETRELAEVPARQSERPNDMRHAMMSLPPEHQKLMQAEYTARRTTFRDWLMSQLIEGVHYGVVPGCEPRTKTINGVTHYGVWNKKASAFDWYPPEQWTPKPSLYAAGADFICDLMGVRDEYESDAVAWQQMGSKAGTAVQKCKLISRATNEVVGESLGAYHNAYDANNAVKMACKCAKVGAVINAYGLRDLFTQEEPPGPKHDNPAPDEAAAPKPAPRGQRPKADPKMTAAVKYLSDNWKSKNLDPDGNTARLKEAFCNWVFEQTGRDFDPLIASNWKWEEIDNCCMVIGVEPWSGE